jgi:hypothetical protein
METPYGEIPEKFVKDMTVQEMHDYLRARYRRRVTGGGDPANASGPPLLWEWTGNNTAAGGTGSSEDIPDTVTDYSAYRRANWSFITLDVTAPRFPGDQTKVLVRAIDPTQTSSGITSISGPAVMDSVTLVRRSRADHRF